MEADDYKVWVLRYTAQGTYFFLWEHVYYSRNEYDTDTRTIHTTTSPWFAKKFDSKQEAEDWACLNTGRKDVVAVQYRAVRWED